MPKPLVTKTERPVDYVDGLNRGTVNFNPAWKNYSFHKVVIPAGTVVRGCNFAQATPRTDCIQVVPAGGSLTLEECNLCNVELDPGWTVRQCLTAQAWIVEDAEGNETRRVISDHPSKVLRNLSAPVDAITERAL